MEKIKTFLNKPIIQHILFWIIVFCCYSIANAENHGSITEILITYSFKIGMQAIIAYTCLLVIIPRFIAKKNRIELGISALLMLFLLQLIVTVWRVNYLEPTYFITHASCLEKYGHLSFWERIFHFSDFFFKNPATYFPPTLVLMAIQYYQKQQKISELSEQKKTAELSNLKNQLNPHFLFNTLNNLYALAVKKSDKAPEAIGKLSDILDYMLYRCNEKYVSLSKEIELIENYLTLEKIRYGKRVEVNFNTSLNESLKIAPLLLLTFIENAFKHGVSPELNKATIDIELTTKAKKISFCIKNSIPNTSSINGKTKESIGLKNVSKQLALLYPNTHQLTIKQTEKFYEVQLNIKTI